LGVRAGLVDRRFVGFSKTKFEFRKVKLPADSVRGGQRW
jgi:hypothetical protein